MPCIVPNGDRPDYLATVDVDPDSASYGKVWAADMAMPVRGAAARSRLQPVRFTPQPYLPCHPSTAHPNLKPWTTPTLLPLSCAPQVIHRLPMPFSGDELHHSGEHPHHLTSCHINAAQTLVRPSSQPLCRLERMQQLLR